MNKNKQTGTKNTRVLKWNKSLILAIAATLSFQYRPTIEAMKSATSSQTNNLNDKQKQDQLNQNKQALAEPIKASTTQATSNAAQENITSNSTKPINPQIWKKITLSTEYLARMLQIKIDNTEESQKRTQPVNYINELTKQINTELQLLSTSEQQDIGQKTIDTENWQLEQTIKNLENSTKEKLLILNNVLKDCSDNSELKQPLKKIESAYKTALQTLFKTTEKDLTEHITPNKTAEKTSFELTPEQLKAINFITKENIEELTKSIAQYLASILNIDTQASGYLNNIFTSFISGGLVSDKYNKPIYQLNNEIQAKIKEIGDNQTPKLNNSGSAPKEALQNTLNTLTKIKGDENPFFGSRLAATKLWENLNQLQQKNSTTETPQKGTEESAQNNTIETQAIQKLTDFLQFICDNATTETNIKEQQKLTDLYKQLGNKLNLQEAEKKKLEEIAKQEEEERSKKAKEEEEGKRKKEEERQRKEKEDAEKKGKEEEIRQKEEEVKEVEEVEEVEEKRKDTYKISAKRQKIHNRYKFKRKNKQAQRQQKKRKKEEEERKRKENAEAEQKAKEQDSKLSTMQKIINNLSATNKMLQIIMQILY